MGGRFGKTTAALLAAVLLAGCGAAESVVQAGAAADGTPPVAPTPAPVFAMPAGFQPLSAKTRQRLGSANAQIRIEDLDPAEVRPRIGPKKAVGKDRRGGTNTIVGQELAFGRVTSRFPCKLLEPQAALPASPRGPCKQTIDGRLAYVVARYVHGDANSLELGGHGPAGPPKMSTWLAYSITDAKTGARLYAAE